MIRNFLFSFFFFLGIVLISIIFIPALFLPQKITLFGGKIMGFWAAFCLQLFLSTKIIVRGRENIVQNKKFFISASHQSMFETFFLQTIFESPVFILKKELLKIPLFGWYLKKISSIAIIRETTTKENLNFFDKIKKSIQETGRPLLIFPQGTRVKIGEKVPFKKGVGKIYETLNLPCIPVALNSGKIWPKNSFIKYTGDIHVCFLEPILPGKNKIEFIAEIEDKIYTETEKFF